MPRFDLVSLGLDFPVNVDVSGDWVISVEWSDGHKGKHTSFVLRTSCPCAMCKGEPGLFGKYYFGVAQDIPRDVHPIGIESVGRYAIKVSWSDGHNSGIYSFDYLRRLCECEECMRKHASPKDI